MELEYIPWVDSHISPLQVYGVKSNITRIAKVAYVIAKAGETHGSRTVLFKTIFDKALTSFWKTFL